MGFFWIYGNFQVVKFIADFGPSVSDSFRWMIAIVCGDRFSYLLLEFMLFLRAEIHVKLGFRGNCDAMEICKYVCCA